MAKRFRDRTSSTWMHVYNRGADGQDIFSLTGDQDLFESLMGESSTTYGVEIHAYALMTNHFHALVHVESGELSEWMRYFCGRYGAAYNVRTSRSGPLFNGRFGSVPIGSDDHSGVDRHLVAIGRYIHRNPLAMLRPATLASYRYSSLGAYLGRRVAPAWLHTDVLAAMPTAARLTCDLAAHDLDDILPPKGFEPLRSITAADMCTAVEVAAPHVDDGLRRLLIVTLAVELRIDGIDLLADQMGISAESIRRTARRGRVRLDAEPGLRRLRMATLDHLAA